MAGVGEVDVGAFIENRCLRILYADRVLARKDWERLKDPRAAEAVAEAVGMREELRV
jgi:hypothetical protein